MYVENKTPQQERQENYQNLINRNARYVITIGPVYYPGDGVDLTRQVDKQEWQKLIERGYFDGQAVLRAYDLCQEKDKLLYAGFGNKYSSLSNLGEALEDYYSKIPEVWKFIRSSSIDRWEALSPYGRESERKRILDLWEILPNRGFMIVADGLYDAMGQRLLEIKNGWRNTGEHTSTLNNRTRISSEKLMNDPVDELRSIMDQLVGKGEGYINSDVYEGVKVEKVNDLRELDRTIKRLVTDEIITPNKEGLFNEADFNQFLYLISQTEATKEVLSKIEGVAKKLAGRTSTSLSFAEFHQIVCGSLQRVWNRKNQGNGAVALYKLSDEVWSGWKSNPGLALGLDIVLTERGINELALNEDLWKKKYREVARKNHSDVNELSAVKEDRMKRANMANDFLRKRLIKLKEDSE